ncbi:hypothetical protein LXL04_016921 [Taraxacum kok-saghyz]
MDHGDQIIECRLCNGKLWKNEALRGKKVANKTCFSICCGYGKVQLPKLKEPPPEYSNLFRSLHPKSKIFMKNIRYFNSMFSFTSMGGQVDKSINKGKGPYVFRLSGQNYHSMGSLLPDVGSTPKFSQLYIYDTENEEANRQNVFRETKRWQNL